jgi:glycosyltransferase involved in cell wall biosynthesis
MNAENTNHGLWIGQHLSRLEQLTLRSFVRHGHKFNLWVYDELKDDTPAGVILRDATEILPRERIFLKAETDPSAGVGRKSYGPFSDLFRYKLLRDHGGIWVDMDVTCLRPFDFKEPYLFRAHPIGLMGNLIKVPPASELMRLTFEHADKIANENISWLTLNRILCNYARLLQLTPFIRKDIINEGSLAKTIVGFAGSRYRAPPSNWYGIHWGNEYWGAQTSDHSAKIGEFVTKNNPATGSLLYELYRTHGLIARRESGEELSAGLKPESHCASSDKVGNARAETKPKTSRRSFNMLVPTLARGGAERIVLDIAGALTEDPDIDAYVYVRSKTPTSHEVPRRSNLFIIYLDECGASRPSDLAAELIARGNPLIFTHLIRRAYLEQLWETGLLTVPVVHNSRPGREEMPATYKHANVPFVVACADSVKAELEQDGCPVPVLTIRYELGAPPQPSELAAGRAKIRSNWGINGDTLVIGMVGQFKSQKAYTRAIRVLARVREYLPAKLMIVGGWDHKYGAGRTTFEATMRLAVELGVVADIILIGETSDPIPYYAAFDVFLNTSIYEGLSISIMEAVLCGCPLVASSVGGVTEVRPANAVLVQDSADIDAYVAGVLQAAIQEVRTLPPRKHEPDLIPRIWLELGRVATELTKPQYPTSNGTLFVIDGLHMGGPAVSLARVLSATKRRHRVGVAVLTGTSVAELEGTIREAGATIFQIPTTSYVSRTAGRLLDIVATQNYGSICFWNAPPELKLLLAKLLGSVNVTLTDVSPGPMLFDEINAAADFQHRIAFTSDQYFQRLDNFISLHKSGLTFSGVQKPKRTRAISLGVPPPPRFIPLPPGEMLLPDHVNQGFAIGTVTRLVPYKRVELLLEAMAILSRDIPEASLTIIGGPDASSTEYAMDLRRKARELSLENVFFVGSYPDVNRFLARWKVFVLAGERQGCPNASLEAMAMGLPVIAFESGGLREQIVNGKTGYLVHTPEELAKRLKSLLRDSNLRRRLGAEARRRIREKFSMERSAKAFAEVIDI